MIKKSKFISSEKEQVIKKIKSIFLKVKHVAKNVIYLKGWSKKVPTKANVSKSKNKRGTKNNFNISFKSYEMKIIKEPHMLLRKVKELRYNSFFGTETNKISSDSDEFDNFCDHLVVVDKSENVKFKSTKLYEFVNICSSSPFMRKYRNNEIQHNVDTDEIKTYILLQVIMKSMDKIHFNQLRHLIIMKNSY